MIDEILKLIIAEKIAVYILPIKIHIKNPLKIPINKTLNCKTGYIKLSLNRAIKRDLFDNSHVAFADST
jgi:hypothetical protein